MVRIVGTGPPCEWRVVDAETGIERPDVLEFRLTASAAQTEATAEIRVIDGTWQRGRVGGVDVSGPVKVIRVCASCQRELWHEPGSLHG